MYITTPQLSPSNNVSYPRYSNKGIHLGRRPSAWDKVKEHISRFRPLKVRPVCGAAVSEKNSQWHGFTTKRKETTATPPIKPKNSHCISDI
jgi:hypothetical protein